MFDVRGLEIHSQRMWRWESVRRSLDLMERLGMNTLIFHQNDIIDQIVLPRAYFSDELMWRRRPVRLHTCDNNRHYLARVAREAGRRGITLYLEVKEIWYPEGLLEIHPGLRPTGEAVCPTDPFWWEFLRAKMIELVEILPEIGGVIVSPATRESRVSIAANDCTCPRCASYRPEDWYRNLLAAMEEPLARAGKRLIVRDFSYTSEGQSFAAMAAQAVSSEIIVALKNTPHDFYPTFPDNPLIGRTGNCPEWVEFDTWGQFFGLGFFPAGVLEDMQQRLRRCRAKGVNGVWFRTDWEGMTEASSFNSLNLLNVFGGGMLAANPDCDLSAVYRAWMDFGLSLPLSEESVGAPPLAVDDEARAILPEIMRSSWRIIERTLFVRGHVFHEDGMFPSSVNRAFDMMVRIHGRDQWDPQASQLVEPTPENYIVILEEKRQALAEAVALERLVARISAPLGEGLRLIVELLGWYVRGFAACAELCFLDEMKTRGIPSSGLAGPDLHARLQTALRSAAALRRDLVERLAGTSYPHYAYWLLDTGRLDRLIEDVESRIRYH